MKIIVVLSLFSSCFLTPDIQAKEIKEVHWALTAWKEATQKDGKGLFHEIVDQVFALQNIKLKKTYAPWKRSLSLVEDGLADMTGGHTQTEKYYQAKLPILVVKRAVFFKNKKLGKWQGLKSLSGKKGVWSTGFLEGLKKKEVQEALKNNGIGIVPKEAAMKMVIAGRADYFLDNMKRLKILQTQMKGSVKDINDYQIETLYENPLYMSFSKNPRGKAISAIYDEGIRKLKESGKLKTIYQKWKREYPIEGS